MRPMEISKMSPVVILIGWLIVIPSILGVLFAGFIFLSGFLAAGSATPTSDAEATGAGLAVLFTSGSSICVGVSSLMGGLVGYLLIMKKKVWKCSECGYHIDRD